MSATRSIYQLAYQISPILLVNGVAASIPGYTLPLVAITQATDFNLGFLGGNVDQSLLDYFAHFEPISGSTLIDNAIGTYPFANQTVAANAIIRQPLRLSMLMKCPIKGDAAYVSRLMTMTALKTVLDFHNQNGGTYTVATPACLYQNLILKTLTDVSPPLGDSKQVQIAYQWSFEQPLITVDTAAQAQNVFMAKLTAGLKVGI